MNVYYANDTQFHAGTVAITESIIGQLEAQGHTVVGRCVRPDGPDVEGLKRCDVLVVNGEGAFRDERRQWEPGRQQRLADGMRRALGMGKPVHLINALWANMERGWGDLLASLDEVAVREPASADEMERVQGVRPRVYLDAAYYAPMGEYRTHSGFRDKVVVGKLYPHNFPDALTEAHPYFERWPSRLPILEPGRGLRWEEIVARLRGARLYITGQHHGVYAACMAQVPFVYCRVNTHKVQGLFDWADVDIPTVRTLGDVPLCVMWALDHPETYRRLFEFMATRERWPGLLET